MNKIERIDIRKSFVVLSILLLLVFLCGCDTVQSIVPTSQLPYDITNDMLYMNNETLSKKDVRVIADIFWNTLQGQYTDIFANPLTLSSPCFSDSDMSLVTYEKEYALYREMLMLMCFSQQYEEGVKKGSFRETDLPDVDEQAEAFYRKHYETALENTITIEDCKRIFLRYAKARKYQEVLRKKIDLVISDEEVRVVSCGIVKCKTQTIAEDFIDNVNIGGDFWILANEVNELPDAAYYLVRQQSEFPKEVEDMAFSMFSGELSKEGLLASDQYYYVIYVKDMFDEKLSAQNREKKLREQTLLYYENICEEYMKASDVFLNYDAWQEFSIH